MAYGDAARTQCARSIAALFAHAPGINVAVVSEQPLQEVAHLHIYHPEADPGARTQKTSMYALSPFARTLFLDADTEVVASPAPGFNLLQCVDVVIAQDCNRRFADCHWKDHLPAEHATTLSEIGLKGDVLYYNTGAIFFRRSERAAQFFARWHEEWQRWKRHDQMAFIRALHHSPVRLAVLRETWNTHVRANARFVWHNHRAAARPEAPH